MIRTTASISALRLIFGMIILIAGALSAGAAQAQVKIVALGASNTYGKGVSRGEAYPAHLQRLLRAKGISATVINAGINGNTTAQMLARLNGVVPSGTKLVILQPGGNDRRRGSAGERGDNIGAIRSRLAARNIAVVILENQLIGSIRRQSPAYDQGDGSHLTGKGYAALAAAILPDVLSALGR
jgi:acyl-CoA thioesterase I